MQINVADLKKEKEEEYRIDNDIFREILLHLLSGKLNNSNYKKYSVEEIIQILKDTFKVIEHTKDYKRALRLIRLVEKCPTVDKAILQIGEYLL